MKLIDIIKENGNKDIPYIEYRDMIEVDGKEVDVFVGMCEYKDGELISLDGDNYSLESEIGYHEWYEENGKRCLKVYISKW